MGLVCERILAEGIDEPLKSFYLPGSPGAPCMYSNDLPISLASPTAASGTNDDDFAIWDPASYYRE